MKNHYAILGLLPNAEAVVVKAAYKALAQRYHPDRFDGDPDFAQHRMAELNEAYTALSGLRGRHVDDGDFVRHLDEPGEAFVQWIRAFVEARRYGD